MKPHAFTRAAVGAAASVAVLLPLTACSSAAPGGGAPTSSQTTSRQPGSPSPSDTNGTALPEYVDGTYTARGVYGGAPSYMDFTVSLEDGVITDVESELMPDNNDTSRGYQERFAAAIPDEVIGASLDNLQVDVIAGASGCADGFNDALAKIRDEASSN